MIKKENLKFLFVITVIIIIFNFYYFVREQSLNQYADWLINYQGGFVRRGLIGEIFYQIHSLLFIRLDILIFLSVSLFYIFFYKNLLTIIKNLNLNFVNLLIIFSPISFIYPIMEEKASGRKDIIFLFFLSFLVLNIKKISFNNQKYLIILFSAISVFSHTGFIFLLPAFLIIFLFSNKNKNPKILLREILIILLSYLIFFLIIINNKIISPENINLICNSISDYVRNDCAKTGYISTLSWSLKYNLYLKENLWMTESYNFFYLIAFFLSFFPLLFTFHYSKFLNYKKISVLFFFTLFFLSSIPLYYLGVDYGRYMHLTYLSTVIIYSVALKNKILITSFPKNFNLINLKMKFPTILLIIFLYGFTFTIPHCCNNNFKFNYSKLIMKINEQLN